MSEVSRIASVLNCLFRLIGYFFIVYTVLIISFFVLNNKIVVDHKKIFALTILIFPVVMFLLLKTSEKISNYENSSEFLKEEHRKNNPVFAIFYKFLRRII